MNHFGQQKRFAAGRGAMAAGADAVPFRPRRVDADRDGRLSAPELQRWVLHKTREHFQEAVRENRRHFGALDPDGDGKTRSFLPTNVASQLHSASWPYVWRHASVRGHISWDEYKIKFLASKGFNEKEIAEKIKNNEELKIDEEKSAMKIAIFEDIFPLKKIRISSKIPQKPKPKSTNPTLLPPRKH
ncbi:hypothetical protein DV515_00018285 [Chloebia gouldiae]|uniref:EF-hand domain-containing protein n=1 Tax=Chloebia gouldiae TaxID=44316 RepID=A0A3L8Q7Z6_CHLGU|nr:hypothetical protein DV515_00018284 [Chloebia gouldiae]RLV63426.1 hypothetical protein DV515_00018285 [Chloebia gouldiae]